MSSNHKLDVGERRAAQGAGRSLRSVFIAVAVFYLTAGLLNGTYLYEDASKREFGKARMFWMSVTQPLAEASNILKLHLFRDQVEKVRKE